MKTMLSLRAKLSRKRSKPKADERFARRFEKIVEKHDSNAYGEDSLGSAS